MNKVKNILGGIWCIWGMISFVGTFLLIFLPSMACKFWPQPKQQDYFIAIARFWMRSWLFLIGCPLRVKGLANFKKYETFVVVFNHNTFLDVPLSCPFIPSGNKTIAKDTFTKIPLFGWYYKMGGIMVNRKSESSRIRSFESMKQVIAMGLHMGIYPEGTRNKTTEPLKPFYDGAFKLAVETKKQIIPCLLFNTGQALPVNQPFFLWPTKLSMHFLPPIASEGLEAKQLNAKVFNTMKDYYVANLENHF